MSQHLVVQLASIFVLGVGTQWLAWRLRLPSILLLLICGIVVGPLLFPLVSLSVAIIVFGSLPVALSKAWNISSFVPPMKMKTSPPAVTMVPPKFSVPVCGTPFAFSAGYSPSRACHANSPRLTSISVSRKYQI